MYYSYEGDNTDLNNYITENGYFLLYDSTNSEISVCKKFDEKSYSRTTYIDLTVDSMNAQYNIARFIKTSVLDIECEILEESFNRKLNIAKTETARKHFRAMEELGVKSVANYSEKELWSWEKEYRRVENTNLELNQYEQMGR